MAYALRREGYGLCVQGGQVIEVSGGCFPTPFRFSCAPNFSGDAGSCAVWGPDPDGAPTELGDCEDVSHTNMCLYHFCVAYLTFLPGQ